VLLETAKRRCARGVLAAAIRLGTSLAVVVAAPPLAAADGGPSPAELASARSLFNEARAAEDRGDWKEALTKLDAVAKVKMTPQVRFHLGLCLEHTTRLVDSLNHLERAASEGAEQNLPTVVEEATEHAANVRTRLPKILIVLPAVSGARVEVDGQVIASVLLSRPVAFDPGVHTIVAKAPGVAFSQEVSIAEGEEKRVDVVFSPVAGEPSASPFPLAPTEKAASSAPPEVPKGNVSSSPTFGWIAVGVGGAAIAGASVSLLVRQGALSDIDSECPSHQNCPRHLESSQSKARTFGALGVVLGVVGCASAATGVVLLARGKEGPTSATLRLEPWTTARGAGAAGTLSW
jgi:hypothetical protein